MIDPNTVTIANTPEEIRVAMQATQQRTAPTTPAEVIASALTQFQQQCPDYVDLSQNAEVLARHLPIDPVTQPGRLPTVNDLERAHEAARTDPAYQTAYSMPMWRLKELIENQ